MHRTRNGLCCLAAVLLGLAGCAAPDKNHIRPPKRPEEYALPPSDDARFSEHIRYPKEKLFQDSIKQVSTAPQPGTLRGPGMGAGAGRRPGAMY